MNHFNSRALLLRNEPYRSASTLHDVYNEIIVNTLNESGYKSRDMPKRLFLGPSTQLTSFRVISNGAKTVIKFE